MERCHDPAAQIAPGLAHSLIGPADIRQLELTIKNKEIPYLWDAIRQKYYKNVNKWLYWIAA
jgi:hypothetical protein